MDVVECEPLCFLLLFSYSFFGEHLRDDCNSKKNENNLHSTERTQGIYGWIFLISKMHWWIFSITWCLYLDIHYYFLKNIEKRPRS